MANVWVEQNELKKSLAQFFAAERSELTAFGSTVNQTFEAFVFASVVSWYRMTGWQVELVHPKSAKARAKRSKGVAKPSSEDEQEHPAVRLKFSTRGRPDGYTRAVCVKGNDRHQVRHGLRVATRAFAAASPHSKPANVCLDVAVIVDQDLADYSTNDAVDNASLLTFGEAKHMSAFAELITGFLGLVYEMMPERLVAIHPYIGPHRHSDHPTPFLYVSGFLYPTAQGLLDTILYRGFDVAVLDHESTVFGVTLPKRVRQTVRQPRYVVPEDEVPF